ncbi:sugar transferase [Virgibacillus soli]|uniref:sugar transferase n=1 Tax=Paracerasibacillus soli TaxID=480284 RepID=UPI0035EC2EF3
MSKILFRFLKRVCDMLVSMCLLLILSPVMVIIAVILYKKEGGPIIFRELRIGKDQRTYMMYVFRTTSKPTTVIRALPPHPFPDSWKKGVPHTFKFFRYDQRIYTEIGSVLHKYKLYKLPLLWNVLKGDMSLIGPEPENPDVANYYNRYQMNRLIARPGIIGYAQLHGLNNITHRKKVEYDLYYVHNQSYLLDLKIAWAYLRIFMKKTVDSKKPKAVDLQVEDYKSSN